MQYAWPVVINLFYIVIDRETSTNYSDIISVPRLTSRDHSKMLLLPLQQTLRSGQCCSRRVDMDIAVVGEWTWTSPGFLFLSLALLPNERWPGHGINRYRFRDNTWAQHSQPNTTTIGPTELQNAVLCGVLQPDIYIYIYARYWKSKSIWNVTLSS